MLGSATLIVEEIKRLIRERTGLTSSAGVSCNKFLSKIASDRQKPDGLCVILPEHAIKFIREMPIGAFHGIGPATEEKMKRLGILNGADLGKENSDYLSQQFGKAGRHYFLIAQGIDEGPAKPDRVRKEDGGEITSQEECMSQILKWFFLSPYQGCIANLYMSHLDKPTKNHVSKEPFGGAVTCLKLG